MISRIERRPRKNGKVSWRVQFWKGYDANGKAVVDSATFHTKGEAENFVKTLNNARSSETAPAVLTLSQYLDQWLLTVESTRTYGTWKRYRNGVAPVRKELGDVRLDKLTASALEAVYAELYKTLANRTVRETHGAIRAALNRAVKKNLLRVNPALACTLRASDTEEAQVLDAQQIDALEAAAGETWLALVIRLAVDTGARRGELAALRWCDLDSAGQLRVWQSLCEKDNGTVFVKPTKSRSERPIKLSARTLEYLGIHRDRQAQNAALMGEGYRSDLDLILANPDGYYMKPQTMGKAVRALADKIGLTGAGLHTLRHSHATILLSNGAPLAAVSKRLGHRDTYTTAKVYSHALPGDEAKLTDLWEAIRKKEAKRKKSPKMVKNGEPAPVQGKSRRKPAN